MISKRIVFTKSRVAELLDHEIGTATENNVMVRMEYTVISGGTERDCLIGIPTTPIEKRFPVTLGYCGVGRVVEIGEDVKTVAVGDRVLVYHGVHSDYNIVPESDVTRVEDDNIDSLEAAFVIIATMGLGGVRKLEIELGESAMVLGLGLLGMFSVQFCRLNGANPVIAVDLNSKRRELALKLGADYALDPTDEDFAEKVMKITKDRGVNACVEVTGVSAALNQALNCASRQGRISLLGCTRVSDASIDFYNQVHYPGVKLIGAHNMVKPRFESYPHHWTHQDDCKAILDMISAGRVKVFPMVSRVEKPENAPEIYTQLCDNKNFPMGTVFDWR